MKYVPISGILLFRTVLCLIFKMTMYYRSGIHKSKESDQGKWNECFELLYWLFVTLSCKSNWSEREASKLLSLQILCSFSWPAEEALF